MYVCMGIPTYMCTLMVVCICIHVHTCTCISMQMAEEVLKSGPVDGEGRGAGGEGEDRAAFEGMEALAKAIETGKREREREGGEGGRGRGRGRERALVDMRTPHSTPVINLVMCLCSLSSVAGADRPEGHSGAGCLSITGLHTPILCQS